MIVGRLGLAAAERGLCPIPLIRFGIRKLLQRRLDEQRETSTHASFLHELTTGPIALSVDAPNRQHYEVPAEFFEQVLGPRMKYSSAYWATHDDSLEDAEVRMLELTCERAQIADGQDILELGCGWGSLSLFMAERFPNSRIVALSNSASQRAFIERRGSKNLTVITADINDFETATRFDRIVSIEMFEHMRNYSLLLERIAGWLNPDGRLFTHVFCHRRFTYPFETTGDDDWMGRYFFTAGLMPSLDLLHRFDDHLSIETEWEVNGTHYQRTAEAWRRNLEARRSQVLETLADVYNADADRWFHRWRLFFLACEELFGYRGGHEWLVAHYRLAPRATGRFAPATGRRATATI